MSQVTGHCSGLTFRKKDGFYIKSLLGVLDLVQAPKAIGALGKPYMMILRRSIRRNPRKRNL